MRTTKAITVTLSKEMAEMVQCRVASGDYSSASAVIQDGLRVLRARDAAMESWLRSEVVTGHKEYLAKPSAGIASAELLATIKTRHLQAKEH